MDIYTKEDSKVIFTGKNGTDFDRELAATHLKVGQAYTVGHIDIGEWVSWVTFREMPMLEFNTVMFENAEEEKEVPVPTGIYYNKELPKDMIYPGSPIATDFGHSFRDMLGFAKADAEQGLKSSGKFNDTVGEEVAKGKLEVIAHLTAQHELDKPSAEFISSFTQWERYGEINRSEIPAFVKELKSLIGLEKPEARKKPDQQLIYDVIDVISDDIEEEDWDNIEELLSHIPAEVLQKYLPEKMTEEQVNEMLKSFHDE